MADLIYIAIIIVFFLLAMAYLAGCDALSNRSRNE